MGRPKGFKRFPGEIKKQKFTFLKNKLSEAKQKFYGKQIIGQYKSIIHWDSLNLRIFKNRTRRAIIVTCGKCLQNRYCQFDNLIKQIKKPYFTGLCQNCNKNMTWLERGRPRPEKRKVTNTGYIKVYMPEHPMADKRGEVYEHRLIISKTLNRSLEKWEHIHHKDGNRSNNHFDNLELLPSKEHGPIKEMVVRIKYLEKILIKHAIPF